MNHVSPFSEASPGFGPWPWHEAPEAPEAEVVEAEGDASARRGDTQDMPTDDIYIYYIRMYVRYIYIYIYRYLMIFMYIYIYLLYLCIYIYIYVYVRYIYISIFDDMYINIQYICVTSMIL